MYVNSFIDECLERADSMAYYDLCRLLVVIYWNM